MSGKGSRGRRDDPKRTRKREDLNAGSEQEIGGLLLEVLSEKGRPPVATEGCLWEYQEALGVWTKIPLGELHRIVGTFDASNYWEGKQERVLRISDAFARGAIRRAEISAEEKDFFVAAAPVLVFKNKAIQMGKMGQIEVLDHSPEHRARTVYATNYSRCAKAPRFLKMMQEHFEGDIDAEDKIACLQEFFGACLFGVATRFQKCLALPSDGGSGRSTMLEIIEAAMPMGSVAHVEAKELRKAERRAKLVDKQLNFSDEVPADAFLESEDFKKIVVGNVISGEEKYRPSFEFRPVAGYVFPIQVSASAELSDAFFRRFIIIRYNHNFEGSKKRDYTLVETIVRLELAGVIAWMIEGASRLLRQSHYTIPASHVGEEAKWKLNADTVRAFLEEMYTKATFTQPRSEGHGSDGKPDGKDTRLHDWVSAGYFYNSYQEWCEANGHRKPVAIQEFKRRVERAGYTPVHTAKGNFYGLRLLKGAQQDENLNAVARGRPAKVLVGAITVLQGPQLTVVK